MARMTGCQHGTDGNHTKKTRQPEPASRNC
jgi:hypothetical protein